MRKAFKGFLKVRVLILIITAVALGFSFWGMASTNINTDVASYLPDDSSTKRAMDTLTENFGINGDALVCVAGGADDYGRMQTLASDIADIENVDSVAWLGSYDSMFRFSGDELSSGNPVFSDETVKKLVGSSYVELEGEHYYVLRLSLSVRSADSAAGDVIDSLRAVMNDFSESRGGVDYSIGGNAVQSQRMLDSAMSELPMFLGLAALIITIILLVSSRSVMSTIVFLLVIGISIMFNMGTNFFTPDVSTVTFSVAAVLQLALSMDYSIFLSHAYKRARETEEPLDAMSTAVGKTLSIILASALTTIAGFCALFAMRFEMGFDLGLCLAKGVLFSFLTVIIIQPCLMLVFRKPIERQGKKAPSPKFSFLAKMPRATRYFLPVLAAALIVPGAYLASTIDYTYMTSTENKNAVGAERVVQEIGTQSVFVVKKVSDEKQLKLLDAVSGRDGVTEVGSYYSLLSDIASGISVPVYSSLDVQNEETMIFMFEPTPEQLAAIADGGDYQKMLSQSIGKAVADYLPTAIGDAVARYSTQLGRPLTAEEQMAVAQEVTNQAATQLPQIITMQLSEFAQGLGSLTAAMDEAKGRYFAEIDGVEYTFFTANIAGSPESDEAIASVKGITGDIESVLGTPDVLSSGNTQSVIDLSSITDRDFIIVSLLSALLIFIILAVTFKSALVPLLLVAVIELAILLNLSITALTGGTLNFMSYIVISAIQMGATIDYAILLTKSCKAGRSSGMKRLDSVSEAIRSSAMPIFQSVLILVGACLSVFFVSSDAIISEITLLISRGAAISALLVLLTLPAILGLGRNTSKKTQNAAEAAERLPLPKALNNPSALSDAPCLTALPKETVIKALPKESEIKALPMESDLKSFPRETGAKPVTDSNEE